MHYIYVYLGTSPASTAVAINGSKC